ncbi:hypothetical protein [Limobrevibacterium gyesilva]|uniref:Uncharacterized protein n=1 Tax=Limobrevibacterium gyesilva TaxID=2991712 RepID=A0AA41YVP3_9PROT|nr:hypothetical protein [Limobrevibacterium gyesilva]MCW3477368.1 hypothetical protein [Limobrevibacterium gyesilva]
MTIVTFPSLPMPNGLQRLPSSATLRLMAATQSSESPFDGSVQTIAMPGAKWHAVLTWPPMPPDVWRVLQAFVTRLGGRAGRFRYTHPMTWRRSPTPVLSLGAPVVSGGGQSGATLVTAGWTASTALFKAGDFCSFVDPAGRDRLHQVLADVSSNGSGAATLSIAPPLRTPPASGVAIECAAPKAVWMLASDDQGDFGQMAASGGARASVSLEIIEALV